MEQLTSEDLISCLTDRPCDVCKFHGEDGCRKWDCVFDEQLRNGLKADIEEMGGTDDRECIH